MTRSELIEIIVPGTIIQWETETPKFKHTGKTESLQKHYKLYNKAMLVSKYNYLKSRGYIN